MKAQVLGCYSFKSKKGNTCYQFTVTDNPDNPIGTCCKNLMAVKIPDNPQNMIGKTYLIDTDGDFAVDFYLLK